MEEEVFEACEVKVGGDLQRIVLHESPLQNIGSILPEHEHLVLGDREEGLDVRLEHGAAVAVKRQQPASSHKGVEEGMLRRLAHLLRGVSGGGGEVQSH